MINTDYIETVRLLLEVTPYVFQSACFSLKGGTALNLFVQDMPRLSVDLDLVYLNHLRERDEALVEIGVEFNNIQNRLVGMGFEVEIIRTKVGHEVKLFIRRGQSLVKVEINHIFRGTLLPIEQRFLVPTARNLFTAELSAPVLAVSELYGGKLIAAMDRQHPRDLYDVYIMYQQLGGLTPEMVECFVCYLAGHNRTIHDILFSREKDLSLAFSNEFAGMTNQFISLESLADIRKRLFSELASVLTDSQRCFLLSLAGGEPEWSLMSCQHLAELPAIRWKLLNLAKLKRSNPNKFRRQLDELKEKFDR